MEKVGAVLAALASGLLIIFFLAFPVQWLWNLCLVPAVSGLSTIGFFQALGLLILANILFKTNVEIKK
jgi:hypothetical protein